MLRKLGDFLAEKTLNFIIVVMFTIMAGAVFIQVVFRYIVHQPIYWSEELPRFLLIWLTFLGSVLAMKNRSHLGITIILNRLSAKKRLLVQFLANILVLLFLLVMVWGGTIITRLTMPNRTAALQMPTGLFYLAAPVGGVLMIIYLVKHTMELFRGRAKAEKGEANE
ncbi:MAG: TRAP transporter small permease [Deltaproteobacteria bacterium]|nr:TRAP transporter small permease [Deltaproteobacteria bacterium]